MEIFQVIVGVVAFALLSVGAFAELPKGTSIRRRHSSDLIRSAVTWTLPIIEGGPDFTFNGTVEEVFTKINLARLEKGYPALDDPSGLSFDTDNGLSTRTDDELLRSRNLSKIICDAGLSGPGFAIRIEQGAKYLQGVKGMCGLGPGPGNCGRISCSYGSAIYWCNDNNHFVQYNCSAFAAYANNIVDQCSYVDQMNNLYCWGQAFDDQNFNVMVGMDSC
ncbi:hypothetical protein F5Y16DRAFT_410729 [Xylariaceae sp. FL0255]|nr:hypothetical protein F5Y16DRAFT_410729 [Xylariaceae sp. FL0255]